ncbi:WXG100 family type VII secretion target [Actinoalloteichus hymeniacidonis]|uniref:Outer membrane channel protein CpnT-like N-terminal domain-containing protein n=1 Tax=Actinoalloteichus hymeniacidonis TaxID=340345 RepID=A0AAC9HV79_9PSEU|nr:hypothetical protein [Actinoalloteichus hymeniacidonis]AOS65771.1 hypothetical protein TL08_24965 [Actinoalloteichus hymeniacidonis]MBB5906138.1 uncharacterized protein YukE [Actinoalloteichus hymeniacidonis]
MRPDQFGQDETAWGPWGSPEAQRVAAPAYSAAPTDSPNFEAPGVGDDGNQRSIAPIGIGLNPATPGGPSEPGGRPGPGGTGTGIGGPDGEQIAGGASSHLEYLSWISRELGVPDPVQEFFGPVVGRWNDMHEQAERWRKTAELVDEVALDVSGPLGGMDDGWTGKDAESFRTHIDQFGSASTSLSETMVSLAEALDTTADGIRQLVMDMVEVLAHGAESVSEAMVLPLEGEQRAAGYLQEMRGPIVEMYELVREVLQGLVQACEGFEGDTVFADIEMAHTYPGENWSFEMPGVEQGPPPEAIPSAAGGGGAAGGGAGGGGGAVGGGGGGAGGGFGGGAGLGGTGGPSGSSLAAGPGASTGYAVPTTSAPAAATAGVGGTGGAGGGMMMGGGGGMGGGGAQQSEDKDRKSSSRVVADATQLFGEPEPTVAPVIGADEEQQQN